MLTYLILTIACFFKIYSRFFEVEKEHVFDYVNSESLPSIAIIIPFFNTSFECLSETIQNALDLEYPHKQVIVVNDGSTDNLLQPLIEKYRLKKSFDFGELKEETFKGFSRQIKACELAP